MANLNTLSDSHFPGLASLFLPSAEPHRKHAGSGLLLLRLVCGLGLLTPLASLGILSTMTVATLKHVGSGDPFVEKGSFELPLLYLTIAILFILAGPGRYALDVWVFRKEDR